MKFCNQFALVILAALICSQIIPRRPLAQVNAQRKEFEHFIERAAPEEMSEFLSLFELRGGNTGVHRALDMFCREVAVHACTEKLSTTGEAKPSKFCTKVITECERYTPNRQN